MEPCWCGRDSAATCQGCGARVCLPHQYTLRSGDTAQVGSYIHRLVATINPTLDSHWDYERWGPLLEKAAQEWLSIEGVGCLNCRDERVLAMTVLLPPERITLPGAATSFDEAVRQVAWLNSLDRPSLHPVDRDLSTQRRFEALNFLAQQPLDRVSELMAERRRGAAPVRLRRSAFRTELAVPLAGDWYLTPDRRWLKATSFTGGYSGSRHGETYGERGTPSRFSFAEPTEKDLEFVLLQVLAQPIGKDS